VGKIKNEDIRIVSHYFRKPVTKESISMIHIDENGNAVLRLGYTVGAPCIEMQLLKKECNELSLPPDSALILYFKKHFPESFGFIYNRKEFLLPNPGIEFNIVKYMVSPDTTVERTIFLKDE
jgi:hypothetical protein